MPTDRLAIKKNKGWPDSSAGESSCLGRAQWLGFAPWRALPVPPLEHAEMAIEIGCGGACL